MIYFMEWKGMAKMAEYIDREALIENLNMFAPEHYSVLVNELICKQPAADVEPVKHGRWKLINADKRGRGGIFKCSTCNRCQPYISDYCPECGAKMDEVSE